MSLLRLSLVVTALVVSVVLALTNPTMDQYLGFVQAELATYKQIFPQVLLFKVRPERGDEEIQNLIIIALKSEKPLNLESNDAEIARLLANVYNQPLENKMPVLTDEFAPVEYNSFAQTLLH